MINIFIQIAGLAISFFLFQLLGFDPLKISETLTQSAIIIGFGVALITIADIIERNKIERFKENISIFYSEIEKTKPWRRWPFLKRNGIKKLLSNEIITSELKNPEIPFDVGTHEIKVNLPTVIEDFFDLPILKDYLEMRKYHTAFLTAYSNKMSKKHNEELLKTHSRYECMYDILKTAILFKTGRLLKIFGISITIGSALVAIFGRFIT